MPAGEKAKAIKKLRNQSKTGEISSSSLEKSKKMSKKRKREDS